MKRSARLFLGICIAFTITQSVSPITLMYSLKIRRVFAGARAALSREGKPIWAFTVLPIAYTRSRHFKTETPRVDIKDKRLLLGSAFNLRCSPSLNTWFELTTAFENERSRVKGFSENPFLPVCGDHSKTGFDDLTVAAGYHLFPTEDVQLDFYTIFGFPTHTKISKYDALGTFVGTRFFGLGFGSEFSYAFIESLPRSLIAIGQARWLHFFDRPWTPVLPCGSTIQPGDEVDLLASLRYRESHEIFEIGYNPTFFLNQAVKISGQPCKTRSPNFVRNGGYITYSHVFLRPKHPIVLGAGFSFNRAHVLETRIYAGWIDCTVVF